MPVDPDPAGDLRQHDDRRPAERDADGRRDPGRRAAPGELGRRREQRAAPHDREDRRTPVRADDEQPDRRVRAGDQRVDHRVVETSHPQRGPRCPREPVEEAADAEHRDDAGRKRDRGRARHGSVRRDRECHTEGHGDEECELLRHTAQARSGRAVAGRLAGGGYGRRMSVDLESSRRADCSVSRFTELSRENPGEPA